MTHHQEGRSIEKTHVASATKYAVGAFVASVGSTLVLTAVFVENFSFDIFRIGGTFYGAHNVSITNGLASMNFLKLLTAEYGTLELLWAVPPVLLAAAGKTFAETRAGQSLGPDEMDGAKAGALVAGGYAVLAVAGTFVVTEGETAPDLVETVLYMGVIYPMVFGGIGGYVSR